MSVPSFAPHVEVKILDPRLHEWGLPRYQTEMAAALDMHACVNDPLILHPQQPAVLIPTGIAVYIGDPHIAAVLLPRSGMGHKKGLVLGNLVGLIDADYTAQIMISAWNRSAVGTDPIIITPGERIAQMMFVPVVRPVLQVVDEFSGTTERGGGGFGSTGAKS
ncbi:dUTP diphosphatase [Magnetospirillum sp. 64-120]|uniref:dUTP diphosphatase n=1 Tax=Magnetospirillum sp. 64-120 TaxID=1895778 RepID=UPI000927767A|nr:dUTP diphosphatase [Magnetospirillum sp. 64-120]OJX77477.1 MAG: aminotransferase [Magnetospirillum sp. 64-120]